MGRIGELEDWRIYTNFSILQSSSPPDYNFDSDGAKLTYKLLEE